MESIPWALLTESILDGTTPRMGVSLENIHVMSNADSGLFDPACGYHFMNSFIATFLVDTHKASVDANGIFGMLLAGC